MGNFSVNHYARIEVGQQSTDILFVLDLAELPSFELLQRWSLQATSPRADLERKAAAEATTWVRQLTFTVNGKTVTPQVQGTDLVIADGAGNLPVLRIGTRLKLAAQPGTLRYTDGTYPERTAGWKEVVIKAGSGVTLAKNSAGSAERSQALTAYPQDPSVSPPQQLMAEAEWQGAPGAVPAPVLTSQSAPAAAQPEAPVAAQAQAVPVAPPTGSTVVERNSGGQVRRGDYLSTALQGKEIGWGVGLICVAVAFWFGALHALEPGHGKTMVAAYLVGERGTPKHAVLLGGMVTFTHTVSVFILGLLTMFLSQYIMPDVISKWLGVISGLTIVWIGGMLLYRRARSLSQAAHTAHVHEHSHGHSHTHEHEPGHSHSHEETHQHPHTHAHTHTHSHQAHSHTHDHDHGHDHGHTHGHDHDHGHTHSHSHGALTHTHDGHTHSHVIEGEISMKSLMALGASGGLVPCPSALVLLLAAVSVGRIGFGLLLLVSFSLGLALVLMATGLLVLYAKKFLPSRKDHKPHLLTSLLPVVSAAVITIIGIVLTGNALGLIPAVRFFG